MIASPHESRTPADRLLGRAQRLAALAGLAGLAVCVAVGVFWPNRLWPAYLVAFLFWSGIATGCLGITMLHHLVGGSWGLPVRRLLEAGAMTMPALALLFVPLTFGLKTLYRWAVASEVSADLALKHKAIYLNENAFLIRAGVYFTIWTAFAYALTRLSYRQDRGDSTDAKWWLQSLSGPGLVLLFLTASFAAIDWVMSLEPDWYSTIFGAMLIVGEGLATFAFMIIVAALLARTDEMEGVATPGRMQDLGNLLLAFVMFWAYMAFSQFLIIWCGNLAEEIPWYLRRTRGGWQYVALALIVFHFFVPFGFLLFRETKRGAGLLLGVALAIVAMHLVDLTWLVLPSRFVKPLQLQHRPYIPWDEVALVAAATVGVGGVWVAVFLQNLKGRPLVPGGMAAELAGGH